MSPEAPDPRPGWAAGQGVRHRADGVVGVVLEDLGGHVRVSFGSEIQYVRSGDLAPLEPQPHDLLGQRRVGDAQAAHLRLLAALLDHSYRYDAGSTLSNARLEPKLHQVFVAHRIVAEKVAPRMILADEVGLGKTIEAGLVIKELRARQAVERVLIVVPASLTRQWQSELATKFNESFEILDGPAAKHFGRGGANPFARLDNVICSLSFATQSKRSDQIMEAGWDMVVFDEAHRVRRTKAGAKVRVTLAYRLAEELKDHADGFLLLTATPVQLHEFELYSLIDLVEPGLFRSFEHFELDRRRIPELNDLMQVLDRWTSLTIEQRTWAEQHHQQMLVDLPDIQLGRLADPGAREEAKDALVSRHPQAAAMVRNRKSELGVAGKRIAYVLKVEPSENERQLYDDVAAYIRETYSAAKQAKKLAVGFLMVVYQKMLTSSSHVLRTSFRRRIAKLEKELGQAVADKVRADSLIDAEDPPEVSALTNDLEGATLETALLAHEIARLRGLADRLDKVRDTKIGRTVQLVERVVDEGKKAVIFTQFIETQNFLAAALEHNGFNVATFNGIMSPDEKEQAIRRFRNRADVLVSTEAGGEGRNLQFANVLVNYDLPWNPMKVEQRIGRLDRIGQTKPVEIYNLVYEGTLEERIVQVLAERIRLFEESVGSLDPILGQVEKDIERLALQVHAETFDAEFTTYADDLAQRVEQARLLEETFADFVLDRASFRRDQANELLGASAIAKPGDLERFTGMSLDYLGGTLVDHSEGGSVINLSPRLASRLKQAQSHRGVFDPGVATQLDDLDFFACGHPLIDRLIAAVRDLPDSAVGARIAADAPPGTWIEVIWRVRAVLIVTEGLVIRHLVGADGAVVSTKVTALPLGDRPVRVEVPQWAPAAVEASEEQFRKELAQHRAEFERRFEEIRKDRAHRLDRVYDSQRERLELQIRQAEEWFAERVDGRASERDLRVMPARRGRLDKDRERLENLEEERSARLDDLQRQHIDIRGEVLSAAVVVGG
jgi:SNF2 family DNA or RNA helicase